MALGNVRQNYHEEVEKAINDQINMELYAFYSYLSLVSYQSYHFVCGNEHLAIHTPVPTHTHNYIHSPSIMTEQMLPSQISLNISKKQLTKNTSMPRSSSNTKIIAVDKSY